MDTVNFLYPQPKQFFENAKYKANELSKNISNQTNQFIDSAKNQYDTQYKENLLKNINETKQYYTEKLSKADNQFELGILVSKFSIIFTLLLISYINSDTAFINTYPQDFLTESIIVGLSASFSTFILSYNRGNDTKSILNGIFIAFLLFFIFNTLMEFSGVNNMFIQDTKLNDSSQQKWLKSRQPIFYTLIGLGGLVMSRLAFKVIEERGHFTNQNSTKCAIECILFGTINALPSILIASDRGDTKSNIAKGFGGSVVMYSGIYLLLEFGGFWDNIFGSNHLKHI
jgi:hypothetical protein